ncbi:MAG: lycopene cyclase domain-containing protein, partial [Bacteroidota bacterium]
VIVLFPFLVVNGLLTGSWIQQEVVWYNNQENLGIRLFTIPVEDFVYGMELILLNVFIYEKLKPASG